MRNINILRLLFEVDRILPSNLNPAYATMADVEAGLPMTGDRVLIRVAVLF